MKLEEMTKEEILDYISSNEFQSGKYGLIWDKEKEPESIVRDCDKAIPILIEESLKNIGEDRNKNNILIQGDNFHSLSVLNYTHNKSVDIIYIDPPYNTGNKDFSYNDKYVDFEDGYRHSKWLNFMQKRLKLARKLLKDDGVIFISIDDNEYAQLKLLCDNIFDSKNFITSFIWEKTQHTGRQAKNIYSNVDYILCYAKNIITENGSQRQKKELLVQNVQEVFEDAPLYNASNKEQKLIFPKNTILFKNKMKINKTSDDKYILHSEIKTELAPIDKRLVIGTNEYKYWNTSDVIIEFKSRWGQSKINDEVEKGTVFIIKKDTCAIRAYYSGSKDPFNNSPWQIIMTVGKDSEDIDVNGATISRFGEKVGTNEEGSSVLGKLVGRDVDFSYPKPVSLIKYLISLYFDYKKQIHPNNITVLDFFAGSGTTGQAVMELNKLDGGSRNFILCTNNEGGICENVTYPRIKNAINGVDNDGNRLYASPLRENLKFFKTDFVENVNNRDQLYFDLTEKCIPMLCMKNDCYNKIESNDEFMIFSNYDKTKYACVYYGLFGEKEQEFLDYISKIEEYKFIYKFSLGEYVDETFFSGIKNYTLESIPYKIIELYKKLIKLSKED